MREKEFTKIFTAIRSDDTDGRTDGDADGGREWCPQTGAVWTTRTASISRCFFFFFSFFSNESALITSEK